MRKTTDNLHSSDLEALKASHQLVRGDTFDEEHCDDWRVRMARRYYNQLYKEYAIIDLSRYKEGKYGLRWRTENEVIHSKGQLVCASKHCSSVERLGVFELPFKYIEDGIVKRELIKVCLCEECSLKLNYHKVSLENSKSFKGKRASDSSGNEYGENLKKGRI